MNLAERIAADLAIGAAQVERTIALLDEGNTVPFIARYRKEVTGSLDDLTVERIQVKARYLRDLEARKETVLRKIEGLGKLTPEIREQILAARTKVEIEDLYLPLRPKRKTRAAEALLRGLGPLADLIWAQGIVEGDQETIAAPYVSEGLGVPDANAAWQGARDIVAERVAEHPPIRRALRAKLLEAGIVESRVQPGREADGPKYRDYFHWDEPARSIPSHRMLAIRRGEKENVLRYRIFVPREQALALIRGMLLLDGGGDLGEHFHLAIEDAYDRLLAPSIEKEVRRELRERAEREAIEVFSRNLRNLLMAPPLGPRRVLGIDPGLRTGCKVAAVDEKGDLLEAITIYPHAPRNEVEAAQAALADLIRKHAIAAVAVGNGTGGRETEVLVRGLVSKNGLNGVEVVSVSEAGASVYSASELARKELPGLDVSLRGAVSIARRLQDPLAELVKIEPRSIGVGQYQHDVNQRHLQESLERVVERCVNAVGVEANTASASLLTYVAGIGPALAESIVAHRAACGCFRHRGQLLDVPGLGPKSFEQAAGFLRIRDGDHPLDASGVHPERYELVERMAASVGTDVRGLLSDAGLRSRIDLGSFVADGVGEPTLRDILAELEKPGRDPRANFEPVRFDPEVREIAQLKKDQVLEGVVTNVTNFGAFVDIGVHQDGLVHISELSHHFIKDPSTVVEVGQRVLVKVIDVDRERSRISLSIKATLPPPARKLRRSDPAKVQARPAVAPAPAEPGAKPRPPARGDGRRPAAATERPPRPRRDATPPGRSEGPPAESPRKEAAVPPVRKEARPARKEAERGRGPALSPDNPFARLVIRDGKIGWKDDTPPKKM